MNIVFLEYPNCTTCKKAKALLKEITQTKADTFKIEERHIVEAVPTPEELKTWIVKSQLPFKKFFNTSGKVYKEMGLKDQVGNMTLEEAATLLASNGMLIKRPLLITEDTVVVGFKEDAYKEALCFS